MNADEYAQHFVKKYQKCNWKEFDLYLFMYSVVREVLIMESIDKDGDIK
jgi:hypothetical protein